MKSYMILLLTLMITACTNVPVRQTWPAVPDSLQVPCGPLNQLPDTTRELSQVVTSVVENYGLYQECRIKNQAWNQWYNQQKQIYESVK